MYSERFLALKTLPLLMDMMVVDLWRQEGW